MPVKLTVRKFGDALGFIVPGNIVEAMALQEGDELFISATPDGMQITPCDPTFAEALDDARAFMRSHREAFHRLSK